MKKTAIILFNLGGPDCPKSVRPFLFNLFYDKAIINLPTPLRWLLAKIISTSREKTAHMIYSKMGGKSPILESTINQARALEMALKKYNKETKVFVSMRYWHPFSSEVLEKLEAFKPKELILLPLYPQFSTTTTQSSVEDFMNKAKKLNIETKAICCYPRNKVFIKAHAKLVKEQIQNARKKGTPRVLFSAHGLPQKLIDKGDPYQWQINETAKLIAKELKLKDSDWQVCFQSKVGVMKWLGPSIGRAIEDAVKDKVPVVVCPITFVSEHSETLVELDIEYKKIAENKGIKGYFRVPTLSTEKLFIEALEKICISLFHKKTPEHSFITSGEGKRICPKEFCRCVNN